MRPTRSRQRAWCRALLVVVGLFACAQSRGQESLYHLRDAAGNPVEFARVVVVGRAGAVTTDAQGRFRLDPEPSTPFEIAVFDQSGTWLGIVRVEQLPAEGPRAIHLPPVEQVQVTVQGGVAPSTMAPPGAAATVISRTENDQRRPDRLIDILEEIPGTTRLGGGQGAVPSLRGLARGRTLILLDDARVTSERRAGPSASYLDPFVLENVEVVRGPGSVSYGADSMGGVIHMRTPVPDPGDFRMRFEGALGAGEKQASGAVELNVPVGQGALLAQYHQRSFSDYDSAEGEVANSQSRDAGFLVKGLLPGKRSRWVLGLQSDRAWDVGKPRSGPATSQTLYPQEDSDRFTVSAELPAPGAFTSFELRAFFGQYRLVTDREDLPGSSLTRNVERSDIEADDASFRLVGSRPMRRGVIRVGFDSYGRFDLQARKINLELDGQNSVVTRTEELAIESARRLSSGVFVELERLFRSDRASVAGGLRVERLSTRNRGGQTGDRSRSDNEISGYLAYTFRPATAWTATAQLARAFREPSLSDRYFSGVTGRGLIEGNPDLLPETSRQFDLSLHRSGELAHFAAYAYYYRIRDLVERFRRSDDVFAFRNRGEQEIAGLELESDVNLGKAFAARLTLSWARGKILDDGSSAADIPPLSATLIVRHRPHERVWWRVGISLAARDNDPGPAEARTPAYGVLDASAGFDLGRGVEARLILGNLLDKAYPASADDDSVLAPGRSASIVLAGKF